jgi:methanol metabolism-related c-type cytochrome
LWIDRVVTIPLLIDGFLVRRRHGRRLFEYSGGACVMRKGTIHLALAAVLSIAGLYGLQRQGAHAADDAKPYKITHGVLDWGTFSGYLRYNASCISCHGPDGSGSSFAPALADSLKTMSYDQFLDIVTNGRKDVSASSDKVMPAWGTDPNVMCFVDDIYAYLKGRSDGAIGRGRPQHVPVTQADRDQEDSCLGFSTKTG